MNVKSLRDRLLTGASLLMAQTAAVGAEQAAPAATMAESAKHAGGLSASHEPLAMTSLWQLTLGMLLVLALILAMAWLLKRSGRFQLAAGGSLRVLGGLSMGSRERVVLIQAGDTQLLLGVAPGRVQTLHVLDRPLQPKDSLPSGGFAEQLGRILGKEKIS
jgi:flagellar protein FliO/FliZ